MSSSRTRAGSSGRKTVKPRSQRGFSVIELLIVMAIIAIMIGIALFSLQTSQRALAVDNAGAQLVDVLRFAKQRALAERQVMRVEVTPGSGSTPGTIQVIDQETLGAGSTDDFVCRNETLAPNSESTINTNPTAFSRPPAPHNFDAAPFVSGKLTVYFNPDGSVSNNSDTPQSFSLVFFTPIVGTTPDPQSIRAITLFGPTGSVRVWRWEPTTSSFTEV